MSKVLCTCARCGKQFYRWPHEAKGETWCSQSCHMKDLNAELNPTRMTDETRKKLHDAHQGEGDRKGYKKMMGRHEHRVVAEQKLGRPLKPGEVVHHKDGNKQNNDPDNLDILPSQSEHVKHHKRVDGRWSSETV